MVEVSDYATGCGLVYALNCNSEACLISFLKIHNIKAERKDCNGCATNSAADINRT